MRQERTREWVALVGRRDEPTDGVRDYCAFLGEALARRGIDLALFEVFQSEAGRVGSLWRLWRAARSWKGQWVLLQYTALAWSRRGFPLGALLVMAALRWRGARTAVVFHDWTGYTGPRLIDRIRRACQLWTMDRLSVLADRSIFPVPPGKVAWLRDARAEGAFIPIGANLWAPRPRPAAAADTGEIGHGRGCRTVAVFTVTEGGRGMDEADWVAAVTKMVAAITPKLRLVVLGRGSEEVRGRLEGALEGEGVDLAVLGILPAEEVGRELAKADALLFVRGEVQAQRGSVVAGIACGLPVVGFGNTADAFPLSEGGVLLAPLGDLPGMAEALGRVLADTNLRKHLRERSLQAQAEYFSWDRIAGRFAETLPATPAQASDAALGRASREA